MNYEIRELNQSINLEAEHPTWTENAGEEQVSLVDGQSPQAFFTGGRRDFLGASSSLFWHIKFLS